MRWLDRQLGRLGLARKSVMDEHISIKLASQAEATHLRQRLVSEQLRTQALFRHCRVPDEPIVKLSVGESTDPKLGTIKLQRFHIKVDDLFILPTRGEVDESLAEVIRSRALAAALKKLADRMAKCINDIPTRAFNHPGAGGEYAADGNIDDAGDQLALAPDQGGSSASGDAPGSGPVDAREPEPDAAVVRGRKTSSPRKVSRLSLIHI